MLRKAADVFQMLVPGVSSCFCCMFNSSVAAKTRLVHVSVYALLVFLVLRDRRCKHLVKRVAFCNLGTGQRRSF